MFTGLVEMTGKILARNLQGEAGKLTIEPARPFQDLEQGESIAVNGVCLTLESGMNGGPLVFHVMLTSSAAKCLSRVEPAQQLASTRIRVLGI